MLLETVVPALIPVAADGVRALFNKFTGGAGSKPANVSEVVELMQAETDRLKVIAEIDKAAPNVSGWVNNVRALQRPVATVLIIGGYLSTFWLVVEPEVSESLASYAQMVTFYIFGDRTYMYFRKGRE